MREIAQYLKVEHDAYIEIKPSAADCVTRMKRCYSWDQCYDNELFNTEGRVGPASQHLRFGLLLQVSTCAIFRIQSLRHLEHKWHKGINQFPCNSQYIKRENDQNLLPQFKNNAEGNGKPVW